MATDARVRTATKAATTRATILERAVDIASVSGLEGLTIGGLASELGMSKSGLFAHFGSKEDLQLAIVEAAGARFLREVLEPAQREPEGAARLRAYCEGYIDYLERKVFAGGCFWAAASAEFDDRPGPVQDAVRASVTGWMGELERQAAIAGVADAGALAFEIYSLGLGANTCSRLLGDEGAFAPRPRRARAQAAVGDGRAAQRADRGSAGRAVVAGAPGAHDRAGARHHADRRGGARRDHDHAARRGELGGLDLYGWVFSSFMLGSLVGTVGAGRQADLSGPARPFAAGLALFAAGLAVAGLALIDARADRRTRAAGPRRGRRAGRGLRRDRTRPACAPALAHARGAVHRLGRRPDWFLCSAPRSPNWRAGVGSSLGLIPLVGVAAMLALPALARLGSPEVHAAAEDEQRLLDALRAAAGSGLLLAGLGADRMLATAALVLAGLALGAPALRRLLPRGMLSARPGLAATILSRPAHVRVLRRRRVRHVHHHDRAAPQHRDRRARHHRRHALVDGGRVAAGAPRQAHSGA